MYAIVASDMDETFIAHDHSIPPANLEAAAAMDRAGVHFVVATGRPYYSVQSTLELLGTKGNPAQYTISLNGGLVCANDGTVVDSHPLPPEVAEKIFRFGLSTGLPVHIYADGVTYVRGLTDDEIRYLNGRMEVEPFDAETLEGLGPVYKLLFVNTDLEALGAVERTMAEEMPEVMDQVEVVYSSERYLEFNPQGVSKGTGLEAVARILDVPMADTIAVGDSLNDRSMLEDAGVGLVVSNVSDLLRPSIAPDHILRSSCDDGALMEVWKDWVEPSLGA